jgi:hypothetical protein
MNNEWNLTNLKNQRPGQLIVIDRWEQYLLKGDYKVPFSIIMPCRYGKSDAIRNLGIIGLKYKKICAAIAVHPSPYLAQQLLETSRMLAWRQRFLPEGPHLHKVQTLTDFAYQSMCNFEWIGSVHIQALTQPMQKALLKEWVKKRIQETGLPPLFVFDEAQRFAKNNTWGDLARMLHEMGCIVVVMSATPFRNDEDDVFGYRKEEISESVAKTIRYVQPCANDVTKLELHTKEIEERESIVVADVNIPFAQGFSEGVLAKLTFVYIDQKMKGYGEGKEGKESLLSELSENEARKALPKIYRDPLAIEAFAAKVKENLDLFCKTVPNAKAIIYGMNDEIDGEANENPKAIQNALTKIAPAYKTQIATLANDKTSDEKACETLAKFCDSERKSCDILLLKQMGDMGLDCDQICVVGLWNSCRSLPSMIQQCMRGGNPKLKNHFVVICLEDKITTRKLDAFIRGEGGIYTEITETDSRMELIDKQESAVSGYMPNGIVDSGATDSDGRAATYEEMRVVARVLSLWPALATTKTLPQIASDAAALGIGVPKQENDADFCDTSKMISLYAENLNKARDEIARIRFRKKHGRGPQSKEEAGEFGPLKESIVKEIKVRSGVYSTWNQQSKERSQDVKDYKKWQYAADAIRAEESNEKSTNNTKTQQHIN